MTHPHTMSFVLKKKTQAFTLVEMVVVLLISAGLGIAVITSLSGIRGKDKLDRAAQQVYDDIMFIRSRSISTNLDNRVNFLTNSTWRLEQSDGAGGWTAISDVRQMHPGTNLTSATFPSKAVVLESTPRGLFNLNGASGDPYITIESEGYAFTKSIKVDVGGALEIQLD